MLWLAHILQKKQPMLLNIHVCQVPFCPFYCFITCSQNFYLLPRTLLFPFYRWGTQDIICDAWKQHVPWEYEQPTACMSCPKGYWRWFFYGDSCMWPHAVPSSGSRQVFRVPLGIPQAQWPGFILAGSSCPYSELEHMIEVLLSTKFMFLGWLEIHISKKWSFIKFNVDEFNNMIDKKWLMPHGCVVKCIRRHGPLDKW